jgi:hypothetical protein
MAGRRRRGGRETFDQFSFARWSSELFVQLCNTCGILHLAPFDEIGNGISRQACARDPIGRLRAKRKVSARVGNPIPARKF